MDAQKVLDELVKDLSYRMSKMDARNGAHWIIDEGVDPDYLIQFSYGHVLRAIERKATVVEVSSSIGRRLRQKRKLKQDSVLEIHAGWFVLMSYIDLGLLRYTKEKTKDKYSNRTSKHRSFVIHANDWDKVQALLDTIDTDHVDMFPCTMKPEPWIPGDAFHGSTGTPIMKKGSKTQLAPFKHKAAVEGIEEYCREKQKLYDALNKLSSTGWRINQPVFSAYKFFFENRDTIEKSPFKFQKEIDPNKRKSMLIEAEAVRRIADKHQDNCFYHLYNFDFRGRIYPNTAFLHEQSSDNAKGILMLDEPVMLGERGMYWLYFHAANSWGHDKLELDDRAQWSKDNLSMLIKCAEDPYTNREWIDAEKPFSFLATCVEISSALKWSQSGPIEEFPSCLPIYIDGTNNGVQHLAAMSKDEEVAPLVNLVPSKLPGDVYMFIANKVWATIAGMVEALPEKVKNKFDVTLETGKALQLVYNEAPLSSEQRTIAYKTLSAWKNNNRHLREQLFPVYWHNVQDPKLQRKTVKRNTMTLGYGGTEYGMGQQILEDTRGLSDYLRDKDYLWGIMMGELVYRTCYAELKGPATLLRLFETLAERSNEKKEPMAWRSPFTGFPVTQEYRKPKSVRLKLKHGPDTLNVQIQVWEESTINESKQKSSTAPNIVHSLDAVHLTLTVLFVDFTVVVVHDSFGCHAANMDQLFYGVRQTFVDLYESLPLEYILEQLDSLDLTPEKGTLDVKEVLKSPFAFS